jgi:hypothetical protein
LGTGGLDVTPSENFENKRNAYFLQAYYYTKFWSLTLSGDNVAPTFQLCTTSMLILLMLRN